MAVVEIIDCARAVQAIYKNEDFPRFQLTQGFYDPKNSAVKDSAYSVGVYKFLARQDTYIISIRGSAKSFNTKDWTDDDMSIAVGRTPDRNNDTLQYTRKLQLLNLAATFILAGHSLGGWMAQYVGVVCDLPFITFNAPPALGTFSGRFPDGSRVGTFKKGLNFRVNYDPVSKAPGKHVGPLLVLLLAGQKHLDAHKAKPVIKSVEASGLQYNGALGMIRHYNQ